MDVHDWPFEGIHIFRDAQMKRLYTEPVAIKILQMMGSEESILPNIWTLGGILMALVATVASIITGARMIRLRLQEKKAEEEEFVRNELAILSPVCWESSDEDEGIELSSCSSSSSHLFPSQVKMMKRKENKEQAVDWGLENRTDLFIARESENWDTERDYGIEVWERRQKKSNNFWPEFSILDERRPVTALFRPLLESFSKIEEFSQFEREEILNMNFKHAWQLGKLKFRQWQQENLPSFAVRGSYNSLFGKEDVVKFWDNLKGRALRTFYVQQGFASALDSRWMSGIASLSNTSQGLLSLWDVDRAASLCRISGNRAKIQGLYMESFNTIITGGPDGAYGRTALKLWDTRMGPRPAAVNDSHLLVPRRILDIKSGNLHKLYVKHDAKLVSIHELRMLGGGPISTLSLEDPTGTASQETNVGELNLLSNCSFAEMEETEERTWWDEDAVLVSEEDDEDDVKDNNSQCVVSSSWCSQINIFLLGKTRIGAVRSISSCLGKQG